MRFFWTWYQHGTSCLLLQQLVNVKRTYRKKVAPQFYENQDNEEIKDRY